MATLKEITALRETKSGEIRQLWDKASERAKTAGKEGQDFSTSDLEEFRSRSEELDSISKEYEALKTAEAGAMRAAEIAAKAGAPVAAFPYPNGGPARKDDEVFAKSLGEAFTESATYKQVRGESGNPTRFNGAQFSVDIPGASIKEAHLERLTGVKAFKTTMTNAAGFAPPNDRTSIVVLSAQRRPTVADFIPQTDTDLQVVKYMEETTFTSGAAATAENAAMGESALAFTERSATVELVGTYLPVTEQQLADVPSVRDLIDQRLTLMLALKEEDMLLSGTGSTPQITGFYNKAGIQSQAKGADSTPDAVYKLFTLIRWTGFAEPSVMFWHPNDWQDVRLLKDTAGRYIWGDPSTTGPEQIWGVRIVQTTAATEGSPLSGDFPMFSHISRNQGAQIAVGYISDDFVKNKLTIKINGRMSLEVYRAGAFGKVTGA